MEALVDIMEANARRRMLAHAEEAAGVPMHLREGVVQPPAEPCHAETARSDEKSVKTI